MKPGIIIAALLACAVPARADDWQTVHQSHPGDDAWCRAAGTSRFIMRQMNGNSDILHQAAGDDTGFGDPPVQSVKATGGEGRITALTNLTAGYSICTTNASDGCAPLAGHACHALIWYNDGKHGGGTFVWNQRLGALTFISDAQRDAGGP